MLSSLLFEASNCLASFSSCLRVLTLSSRSLLSLSHYSSFLFLSSLRFLRVRERFLFSSVWTSLFLSISRLEAMRALISDSRLSHIRFKVEFYLTVSSIWTLTLWICIFRLSTSFLNSVRFFFDISIFALYKWVFTCVRFRSSPSHPAWERTWILY